MEGIDESLLNEFVEECREHLTSLESEFMTLEKDLANPDPEVINTIFRAIHTIKGSCGFFNLTAMGSLSHTMETLLSNLRDRVFKPTQDMLDALLAGIDLLNTMVDDVESSNSVEFSEIDRQIAGFYSTGEAVTNEVVDLGNTEEDISDAHLKLLDRVKGGEFLYELEMNLSKWEKISHASPVVLVEQLANFGEVLQGVLQVSDGNIRDEIPKGDTYYVFFYKTVLEPSLIEEALDFTHITIRSLFKGKQRLNVKTCLPVDLPERDETEVAIVEDSDITDEVITTASVLDASSSISSNRKSQSQSREVDSLRVKTEILNKLMMLAGELVLVRNQQLLNQNKTDNASRTVTQRLDVVTSELQETIMRTRMQPIGNVFNKFTRVVRDIGKKLNKKIDIATSGNDVEVDKNILEALGDPLTHIVRNSCDHGIESPEERRKAGKSESGIIKLMAYHEGGQINIRIRDDGKGISVDAIRNKAQENGMRSAEELDQMSDQDILSLILLPGFSTASKVSDLSGRGVGMDVVKTSIEKLGGVVEIDSELGQGTTLLLKLPLTLAIIPSLIVEVKNHRFAIPQINLDELVCLYDEDVFNKIECVGNKEVFRLRDKLLPMVRLSEVLHYSEPFTYDIKSEITERNYDLRKTENQKFIEHRENGESFPLSLNFAVLKIGKLQFGLIIDSIVGTEEIVVKPMHRALKHLGIYAGATVLGEGEVALILDVLGVAQHACVEADVDDSKYTEFEISDEGIDKKRLLLFSNEGNERFAIEMSKIKRVEKLSMKDIELIGDREFITVEGATTRIVRLQNYLEISEGQEHDEMFLILPKESSKPYGVLTSKLLDIGEFEVEINKETYQSPGLNGSALIDDHLTLFVNSEELVKSGESEWYC